MNYVGNYLIPGADSEPTGIAYSTGSPFNRAYFADNYFNDRLPEDPWDLVSYSDSWTEKQKSAYRQTTPFESGPVELEDAESAYRRVLHHGGASLPKRDAVDERIVSDVRNRTGRIIKSQEDVGGWPELKSAPAPKDSDRDGMPDDWEEKKGLDINDPEDRNRIAPDGFTMLETYLNNIK
jgi:pectate lyase